MAALAIYLFYMLLASRKVDSAIVNIQAITRNVGEFADFLWNASVTPIVGSQWGLLDPSGNNPPKPLFINTVFGKNVSFSKDLDTVAKSYKNRVHFIGNLSIGRAWFRITDLNINDTKQYRATIQENFQPMLSFTVSLTVLEEPSTTSAPSTTPSTNGSSSTPSPPTPTTPAPSENYIVKLNGTINITKENEPSDVEWYIGNQTYAVFRNLSVFHNVTVEVYKQSSTRFIINLTLWFDEAVNESTIEIYVGILLDRIKNTSHFSSTITAISTSTPIPTTPTKTVEDDCTTGLIVGCVIGLIIAVVIIIVIAVIIYKRKKAKKEWTTLEKGIIGFGLFVAVVVIIVIIVLFLVYCS